MAPIVRGAESMVMEVHGNVRGEVRVNFLALFASKPHVFMCGALKSSGIVRANVRLNIASAMLFWSLILHAYSRTFMHPTPPTSIHPAPRPQGYS